MKNASALRAAAVGLALTMCALLLGLSHAHHALPGDTFQVARTASAVAAAPGAEAPHGRKPLKTHDNPADGQVWHATLPDVVVVDPRLVRVAGASAERFVHRGRCAGTPGCRGPPTS
ncbi:hypothetical protein ACFFX1_18810 [Dactylosporangium sucinum]|uniref:Uncharacterized protein n=1 Tax=Dactylosporangium sucinum TaxID=1424081 RepID=A0A917U0M4_9ACTN|nr:hypothetical protein [Dactylosporangium sucinum]GGM46700.1 hypothetical protein GCM10007977_055500 [Dactylosporangium sucinum]